MIRLLPKILLALFILAANIFAQQGTIRGVVVDSANSPVPDVNVKIKGSSSAQHPILTGNMYLITYLPGVIL